MKPNDLGAFCLSCQKNVHDFSTKSLSQIKEFFTKKAESESICARFNTDQLEALSFEDFFSDYLHWKYFQKAALIVFFVFGWALFANAQTVNGSPKIKKDTVSLQQVDPNRHYDESQNKDQHQIKGKVTPQKGKPKKDEQRRVTMGEPEISGTRED